MIFNAFYEPFKNSPLVLSVLASMVEVFFRNYDYGYVKLLNQYRNFELARFD